MTCLGRWFGLGLVLGLLVACSAGGDDPSGPKDGTGTADLKDALGDVAGDQTGDVLVAKGALAVTILSAAGLPLEGISVTVAGTTVVTAEDGLAAFAQVAAGRVVAGARAPGFAPSTAVAKVNSGLETRAVIRLVPLGTPLKFQAQLGAVLVAHSVRVELPAGAVVDAEGNPVTGEVELAVAGIDPTTAEVAAAPGPFEGVPGDSAEPVSLKSFYLAEISLGQDGVPLQLAEGQQATLEFAIPEALQDQVQVGDTIPAWWFDLEAGIWRQDGEGVVKEGAAPGAPKIWSAKVSHFTWWNADQPYTQDNCVRVTIVRAGSGDPISGAQVSANGLFGEGRAFTDAQGKACVEFAKGEDATVMADFGTGTPEPVGFVQGWDLAAGCDGMGDPCKELTLTLVACTDAGGCDDLDPCTVDSCEAAIGACLHAPKDCRDANPCTTDTCDVQGACKHEDHCDDGDLCTVDTCLPTGCLNTPVSNQACDPQVGCGGPQDCEDGVPCTVEDCLEGSCSAALQPVCGQACTKDGQCTSDNLCEVGVCLPGLGCFLDRNPCDDGNACTADTCDDAEGCLHAAIEGCTCQPQDRQACCGHELCWVDSCGVPGEVAEDCPETCREVLGTDQCANCLKVCPQGYCGDDQCGGTCACGQGKECNPNTKQCETPCVPQCGGGGDNDPVKECGPDGCGGDCGTCTGDKPACNVNLGVCVEGCTANDHKGCCDGFNPDPTGGGMGKNNAICWFDSCGVQAEGDPTELCGLTKPTCVEKEAGPACALCGCGGLWPGDPYKCGVDNGCGELCLCPVGMSCSPMTGTCGACTKACGNNPECGDDDGCGGKCLGTCPEGQHCDKATATCKCTPVCTQGMTCGASDGCDGKCNGTCPNGKECQAGVCQPFKSPCGAALDCVLGCGTIVSGCSGACLSNKPQEVTTLLQNLLGCVVMTCGNGADAACAKTSFDGICKTSYDACAVCVPASCEGRQCGDVGCATSCGTCPQNQVCTSAGQCCTPNCSGKDCGDNGCGGSCGTCGTGTCQQNGTCACDLKASVGCCDPAKTGLGPQSSGPAVCFFDSCGKMGEVAKQCSVSGCSYTELLSCDGCYATCWGEGACGDSGCGFDCGFCTQPKTCIQGEGGSFCGGGGGA